MPNPFAKTRKTDNPYAIYRAGDMTWHVLKTYKQVKNEDTYARWFVAAKSDATWGSFEMGDTYAIEVKRYGQLVAAESEWQEAYDTRKVPTPAEYLAQA
jgi:hypothetical protein